MLKEGVSIPPHKVIQNVSADSVISMDLQQMAEKKKEAMEKLLEIAFYLALKEHLFTECNRHVALVAQYKE